MLNGSVHAASSAEEFPKGEATVVGPPMPPGWPAAACLFIHACAIKATADAYKCKSSEIFKWNEVK